MRFFNTAGPVNSKDHYCLLPLQRMHIEEIEHLIGQKQYFVLHAPRQTGKTSCLLALMEYLNKRDDYRCLYVNVESAQAARENVKGGIKAILNEIASRASFFLKDDFLKNYWLKIFKESGEYAALTEILSLWSKESDKPLVLLIDEIDSLVGDTLISVLRQIRSGYDKRPAEFPQSIILCGVRDVRDYRLHSAREKAIITGGSAFNIKAKSLRLGDFSRAEVEELYQQHTQETGQRFSKEAIEAVWEYTNGQPWLVNALGYEVCFEMKEYRDRSIEITADMITEAKENIIIRRDTHIDQLADKLQEERVRRVIEPILAGESFEQDFIPDDIQYLIDLGLIKQKRNGEICIANKIYQEVIPRQLSWGTQSGIAIQQSWYIKPDSSLDMDKLMRSFQEFFREHSEHWVERFQYKEAGPQLLLQAYLQRIVNSGGRVEREYGLGRMRTDLLVSWPYEGGVQKIVIELKVLYKTLEETIIKGCEQTAEYMDKSNAREGHLVIFDRREGISWEEKIFQQEKQIGAKTIKIWGM